MTQKVIFTARELIEKGQHFVLARIVETEGSTPRKKGAIMLLSEDGEFEGTIGGGKIEAVTQDLMKETLNTKEKKKLHKFKLNNTEKDALDMGCGGNADVLIEYIDTDSADSFLEEYNLNSKVYIFGGGHVAKALEVVLRYINFKTIVIDDREEYANAERFPEASDTIVLDSFKEPFKDIETDENDFIVIVTRGHRGDYDVLRAALKQKFLYLGMIGSRRKNNMLFDMLREEGYTEDMINKVHAPIGLPIHAETPEEIAISIAGEMIQARAGFDDR